MVIYIPPLKRMMISFLSEKSFLSSVFIVILTLCEVIIFNGKLGINCNQMVKKICFMCCKLKTNQAVMESTGKKNISFISIFLTHVSRLNGVALLDGLQPAALGSQVALWPL